MADKTDTIIWKRQYDEAGHRKRIQRLQKYYLAPTVLIVVATAIFMGIGPASGVLILLGSIGGLLFLWMWMLGFNLRMNPIVSMDDGYLCCGKKKVRLDQVTAFSTYMSYTGRPATPNTNYSANEGSLGRVTFILSNQEEVGFTWPQLEKEQLDRLKLALENVLPGKWCSIEKIRTAS